MSTTKENKSVEPKSIKLNMVLNSIREILAVIFPLITFRYITIVLGVENVGKFNFAKSIISYFLLIAALGISNYARRDGAIIKDNKKEFQVFSNEIFSINMLTTLISYACLFIYLLVSIKAKDYLSILCILSLNIILKTIGVEWIYTIYEDYIYITVRSIIFQIISLTLLFIFVRDLNDLINYTWIYVFSSGGAYLLNFFHSRKYCSLRLTKHLNLTKHLKPMLIFFASNISIVIYGSSDTTILGYLCSDYNVGLYSVSVNIYSAVNTIISSAIVVSISRLSGLAGTGRIYEFRKTAPDVFRTILTLLLPAIVGLIIYRREIIYLVSGKGYIQAEKSLFLLTIALFACLLAYFWGQCILIPYKCETYVLKVTIISALINIVLNFLLIPFFAQNAAAFTTIIAEGFTAICCMYKGKKFVQLENIISCLIKIVIGCIAIIIISITISVFIENDFIRLFIGVFFSVLVYFLIELILKNETLNFIIKRFKK